MEFDADEGLTEDRFLDQVEVLLFATVHELGVLTLPLQNLLHVLHVDTLILSSVLLLFVESLL